MLVVLETYLEGVYWLTPRSFKISALWNIKIINKTQKGKLIPATGRGGP
jgi:hypothetical protein